MQTSFLNDAHADRVPTIAANFQADASIVLYHVIALMNSARFPMALSS